MISSVFYILNFTTMLHPDTPLSPSDIADMAKTWSGTNYQRFCNFMLGVDDAGVNCFYLYIVNEYLPEVKITVKHYNAETSYDVETLDHPEQGDHLIYKYKSYDGETWELVDTGSVYDKEGTEWLIYGVSPSGDGTDCTISVPTPYLICPFKLSGDGSEIAPPTGGGGAG